MRRLAVVVAVVVALGGSVLVGCSSDEPAKDGASVHEPGDPGAAKAPAHGACDDSDPSECLFPWPNDRFTRYDASTPTRHRVDLPKAGMPANKDGKRIDPTEWNRNDGFAPTSILMTHIDGLDVERSKLPPVTDIGASLDADSPLVVVSRMTGQRLAAWAELDANAEDPSKQALLINAAAAFKEGDTISVGLRNLKTAKGDVVPSKGFAAQLANPDAITKQTLLTLVGAGVKQAELDLAWSFTVGSAESISGRLRKMWKDTQLWLQEEGFDFEVTSDEETGAARVVQGTFTMPKFLAGDGGPGSFLNNEGDPNGTPEQDGTMQDAFFCTVPKSATGAKRAGSVIYGHGLLGTRQQTLDIGLLGATVNLAFCGLDYLGMSTPDVPAIAKAFADLTAFRTVPDRLQQGHLGFLILGRLLADPKGFASNEAFQDRDGKSILDPDHVSLLGASQGGILGGVASSLTKDWKQTILAVPGMGYNLLLRRSIDFDEFKPAVEEAYPDELDQSLLLDLLEQLWQRGENAGYAQHLTRDPYPEVGQADAKHVMLLEAFGDHQVANVSTEKLARTLQIGHRVPALADGRSSDIEPFFGIPEEKLPSTGSALITWDFGTPTPPTENLPNRQGEDPHGKLADVPEALALVLDFVTKGQITDVCTGDPCHSPG